MASGQTMNYQLNQWEAGDHVLRTEFNADNAKIDAALAGKIPMTVLHDITLTEDTNLLELDMKAEEWSRYTMLMLSYMPNSQNNGVIHFNVGTSNSSSSHWEIGRGNATEQKYLATTTAYCSATLLFFPGGQTTYIQALTISAYNLLFGYSALGYHTWPLTLSGTTMKVGTRIRVLGIL